ncbi:hypothetical protein [Rhodococcus sp. HNM0569]|uniref:hypothetical protein n=1 Tax=Rhodococcus sp. HNM0569 TaxID=2716340 RepID=UPI00146CB7AB|nr:hypothetical protein [Rhodococcus sp. HNM0569]NLU83903.1 hypothetical protein [Rhodococcus sp. HNM0569]
MTGLLVAEARKVLSLRFWWVLGLAPLTVGLFSSALTVPTTSLVADNLEGERSAADLAATLFGVGTALFVVVLFAAVFGAVNGGSEARYGTLTTTFATSGNRDRVVAAKLAVTAAVAAAYAIVVDVVCVGALVAFGGGDVAFGGDLFTVLGLGVVLAIAWAWIGTGVVLVTGASVGTVVGLVVWYAFGELIVRAILAGLGIGGVADVLPVSATLGTVVGAVTDGVDWLPGWPFAPLVVLFWTAVAVAAGWLRLRTRDIT